MSTVEINDCAKKVLLQKESELDSAYSALLKGLTGSSSDDSTNYAKVRAQLSKAQRLWRAFRDSDCDGKYTLNEEGSMRNAVFLTCLIQHTEQRRIELLRWTEDS
jgi:uncharacterized protein YecT (DUF1311 family)